ncbi:MAG TPA: alpha/beta hydrolase [Phnomibacter sp.]|nr:alpha/beta hydrolase [Phnomibacter sp.]
MLFFITNRQVNADDTLRDDGKDHPAGDNIRFGEYQENATTLKGAFVLYDELTSEKQETDVFKKDPAELKGSARFFRNLYEVMRNAPAKKGDVLFFVHGYNTSLTTLRDNFKELKKRYIAADSPISAIVVFTWPSIGGKSLPLHYYNDKMDAFRSGHALARAFEKFYFFIIQLKEAQKKDAALFPDCNRSIHLMVHSMGHQVIRLTFEHLRNTSVPQNFDIFKQVFLMAGDVQYNCFETEPSYQCLIDYCSQINIYYHNNDKVLDLSKYAKNFTNRLGRYGRREISPGLWDVYDCDVTKTKDDVGYGKMEDQMNHWYYYTSSDVAKDIRKVLLTDGVSDYAINKFG